MASIRAFVRRPRGVGAPLNIYMLSPARIGQHMVTLMKEPDYFRCRLQVLLDQLLNPSEPWLTKEAIGTLQSFFHPDMKAFEWGSGRSTLWIASRVKTLVSVEHNEEWFRTVAEMSAKKRVTNVDLRFASIPTYASVIDDFPDQSFDFILIDGEARDQCILKSAKKVKVGGWICLDNADEQRDVRSFANFEHRTTSNGVWRTDLYIR